MMWIMRAIEWLCLTIFAATDVTPRGDDPRSRGHIWIVDQQSGSILQVHRIRGVLRQVDGFDRPRDVEVLPSGHFVVAGLDGKVIEVDLKGRKTCTFEVREKLYAVRHLHNGNLLVAADSRLIEVNREGSILWEFSIPGCPGDLAILPNGNYLLAIYGGSKIVEINKRKGELWSRSCSKMPMSVQWSADGNLVIAEVNLKRVSEWGPKENLIREIQIGSPCPSAYRTRRGGTLISTWLRVYEVNTGGITVWEGPPVSKCIRAREF